MPETGFVIDPRLVGSNHLLGEFPLSRVFFFDDARFPWLMLVPRRKDIREILDLAPADRHQLLDEGMKCSEALLSVSKPDKINIGALGNGVPQLHFHVVGRFVSDAAWPKPVWQFGERQPYPAHTAALLIDKYKKALGF
jgi:diadenosine tetraphosphate (Ap4A) HIT family hydrolase